MFLWFVAAKLQKNIDMCKNFLIFLQKTIVFLHIPKKSINFAAKNVELCR